MLVKSPLRYPPASEDPEVDDAPLAEVAEEAEVPLASPARYAPLSEYPDDDPLVPVSTAPELEPELDPVMGVVVGFANPAR